MSAAIKLNYSKIIFILIFVTAFIFLLTPVFAEDTTSTLTPERPITTRINTRKQNLTTRIASREGKIRENLEERKAKMASRTAELKAKLHTKLQTFKDKKKADTAERVNDNLNQLNKKHTEIMGKLLDRMSQLLDKLEARVNKNTPDIKNHQAALDAIAAARVVIVSAQDAVQAQSEKDYTIAAGSESTIKKDAKAKREQLSKDLKALRQQVIDAKQKVADAVRISKSGSNLPSSSGRIREGTISGQQ